MADGYTSMRLKEMFHFPYNSDPIKTLVGTIGIRGASARIPHFAHRSTVLALVALSIADLFSFRSRALVATNPRTSPTTSAGNFRSEP